MTYYTPELLEQLTANDAKLLVLDFSQVTLTKVQLAELKKTLQANTTVGRIKWGQVEDKALQAEIEQFLKRNNANFRDRPSDYEYAMLSEHVYETLTADQPVSWNRTDGTTKSLPDWQVHTVYQDTENGYYGAAYYHPKHHFLVLCHRGTDFKLGHLLTKTDSDIHADIQLAYNQIIAQQVSASAATQEMVKLAKAKHWYFSLSGHSLGGWLAQVSLLHCHQDYNYSSAHAVVFDAPGVASMAQRLQATILDHQTSESVLDIKNYVAAPNVVNTLHKPFGRMYRVFPKIDQLTLGQAEVAYDTVAGIAAALFGVALLEKFKPALDMLSSAPGHAITGIVDVFDADTGLPQEVQEVISWPIMHWPEESAGMNNAEKQLVELRKSLSFAPSLTDFKWANAPSWLAQLVGDWAAQKTLKSASYYLLDTQLVQVLCLLKDVHDNRIDNKALLDFLKIAKATQQVHVDQAALSFEEGYHLRYQTKYHTESYQAHRLPQRQLPAGLIPFVKTYHKNADSLFALREDLHPNYLGIHISDYAYKSAIETYKPYDYLEATSGNVSCLRSQLYRYWQIVDEAKHFSWTYQQALVKQLTVIKQSNQQQEGVKAQIKAIEVQQQQLNEEELKLSLDLDGRYQALVSCYQAQSTLDSIDDKWQPNIEDAFVNLAIVEEAFQREAEKRQPKFATEQAEAHYSILETSSTKHINVEAIVNQNPDKQQRTLVLGRPGIGKSVLCHYIAWRWSQGQLWKGRYRWVFWLKLRSLTDTKPINSWLDIINETYLHYEDLTKKENKEKRQLLEKTLQEEAKNGRVLFLLDGYDEIAEQHQQSHWSYKKALDELLKMPQVIITSRPYYVSTIKEELRLEILGFTPANIQTYVQRFFSKQPQQAQELQRFLQHNPSVISAAHIPINLYMLCTNWQEHEFELESVNTLTRLYSHMAERLLRRHLGKSNVFIVGNLVSEQVYDELQQPLSVLELLAWQGVDRDQVEFKGEEGPINTAAKSLGFNSELRKKLFAQVSALGFLRFVGAKGRIPAQMNFHFIHYSFQEFFAARYFINLLQSDGDTAHRLLSNYKFNPNYEWVWAYVAGLLEDKPVELKGFLHRLLQDDPVDLAGLYNFRLLVRCLDQSPKFLKSAEGRGYLAILMQIISEKIDDYKLRIFVDNEEVWIRQFNYLIKQLANTFIIKQMQGIPNFFINIYDHTINAELRKRALDALGQLGMTGDKVITVLIRALQDNSPNIKRQAANTLGQLGVSNEHVIKALIDKVCDEDVGGDVIQALGQLGVANDEVITVLVNALSISNSEIRVSAAEALGKLSQINDKVINILIGKLKAGDTRRGIAWILNLILRTDNSNIKASAAETLGHLKVASANVIEALEDGVKDSTQEVNRKAVQALGRLGMASNKAIDILLKALKSDNNDVKIIAASTFGQIGKADNKIIDALVEILHFGDTKKIKRGTIWVMQLLKLGGNISVQGLEYYFEFSKACLKAIGAFKGFVIDLLTSPLIPTYFGNFFAKSSMFNIIILEAIMLWPLKQLISINGRVIDKLIEFVIGNDYKVRAQAALALGQLKVASDDVVSALIDVMNGEDEEVSSKAAQVLGQLGVASVKVKTALSKILNEREGNRKNSAALTLCQLGLAPSNILNSLQKLINNKDDNIRMGAIRALTCIMQTDDSLIGTLLINDYTSAFILPNIEEELDLSLSALINYFLNSGRKCGWSRVILDEIDRKLVKWIQCKLVKAGSAFYVQKNQYSEITFINFYQNKQLIQLAVDSKSQKRRAECLELAFKASQVVKVNVDVNAQAASNSLFISGVAASELPAPALTLWHGIESLAAQYQYVSYDKPALEGTTSTYSSELMPIVTESLAEEPIETATQATNGNIFDYFHLDSQLALLNVIVRDVRQILGYGRVAVDTRLIETSTLQSEIIYLKQQLNDHQHALQAISTKLEKRALSPQLEELKERVSYYQEILVDAAEDINSLAAKRRVSTQQWSQLSLQIKDFVETLAELKQDCKPAICHVPVIGPRFFQPQRVQHPFSNAFCLGKVITQLPEESQKPLKLGF